VVGVKPSLTFCKDYRFHHTVNHFFKIYHAVNTGCTVFVLFSYRTTPGTPKVTRRFSCTHSTQCRLHPHGFQRHCSAGRPSRQLPKGRCTQAGGKRPPAFILAPCTPRQSTQRVGPRGTEIVSLTTCAWQMTIFHGRGACSGAQLAYARDREPIRFAPWPRNGRYGRALTSA
jgi:hypothetical protein